MIKLVFPRMEHKESIEKYKKEFFDAGDDLHGCSDLETAESYEDWLDFENRLKKNYKENFVSSTQMVAIQNDEVVGMIALRHELNEFLYNFGGHIGYSVLPSKRRQGIAKEMLKMFLPFCKVQGLEKVLLCIDKENIASKKTILANGGILENEIEDTVHLTKSGKIERYWINL